MIETAGKYRIVSDPKSRVLEIQDAVTWAPISTLSVPDDPRVFAAVRNPECTAQFISEQLYKRIRIHVPVEIIPIEAARAKISRQSRKPVRFFDLRTP